MQVWVDAWLFSVAISLGVYVFAKRASLSQFEAVLVSIASFPAPLFVAIGGANSFVYAIDLICPMAMWAGCAAWRCASRRIRLVAIAIIVGAGILPLVVAAIFSSDSHDVLYDCTNLYRLLGSTALMVRLSAKRQLSEARDVQWLHIFSWVSVVLAAAMIAQKFGMNSDLFGNLSSADLGETSRNGFFFVLGLFRGSLGILGSFAISADLANSDDSTSSRVLTAIGAGSGLLVIVLAGSKTSLIAAFMVLGGSLLLFQWRRTFLKVAIYFSIFLTVILAQGSARTFVPQEMADFIGSAGEEHETLDERTSMWGEAISSINSDPLILFGAAQPDSMPKKSMAMSSYVTGAYHNEFISVLMLGGIYSLALYGVAMVALFSVLWRGRAGTPSQRFAFACFVMGLIHSFTVAHVQPSLLFGSISALTLATYGYGARGVAWASSHSVC